MNYAIAAARLHNQFVTRGFRGSVAALVARFGAVQAQEYPFARWALGLRLARAVDDGLIARAFDVGEILRTHVMRPTWHFVTPDDIHWMLELTAPHVLRVVWYVMRREGIDRAVLTRSAGIVERALAGGQCLTRAELSAILARHGVHAASIRMSFIMMYAELEGIVCSGPRRGNQFTYALIAERAPAARRLPRDEALGTLVQRYFTTHGPATVRDFVWWSGLSVADTKRGLQIARATKETTDGYDYWRVGRRHAEDRPKGVYLLPIYDEYIVAYRDRVAVPHGPGRVGAGRAQVTFRHALICGGQVAGTWNIELAREKAGIVVTLLRTLTRAEKDGVEKAASRLGTFLGRDLRLSIGS